MDSQDTKDLCEQLNSGVESEVLDALSILGALTIDGIFTKVELDYCPFPDDAESFVKLALDGCGSASVREIAILLCNTKLDHGTIPRLSTLFEAKEGCEERLSEMLEPVYPIKDYQVTALLLLSEYTKIKLETARRVVEFCSIVDDEDNLWSDLMISELINESSTLLLSDLAAKVVRLAGDQGIQIATESSAELLLVAFGKDAMIAIPRLKEQLNRCTDENDLSGAVDYARILGRLGADESLYLPFLKETIESGYLRCQSDYMAVSDVYNGISALSSIGRPLASAKPLIVSMTKEIDVGIRSLAYRCLGGTDEGSSEVVSLLGLALQDFGIENALPTSFTLCAEEAAKALMKIAHKNSGSLIPIVGKLFLVETLPQYVHDGHEYRITIHLKSHASSVISALDLKQIQEGLKLLDIPSLPEYYTTLVMWRSKVESLDLTHLLREHGNECISWAIKERSVNEESIVSMQLEIDSPDGFLRQNLHRKEIERILKSVKEQQLLLANRTLLKEGELKKLGFLQMLVSIGGTDYQELNQTESIESLVEKINSRHWIDFKTGKPISSKEISSESIKALRQLVAKQHVPYELGLDLLCEDRSKRESAVKQLAEFKQLPKELAEPLLSLLTFDDYIDENLDYNGLEYAGIALSMIGKDAVPAVCNVMGVYNSSLFHFFFANVGPQAEGAIKHLEGLLIEILDEFEDAGWYDMEEYGGTEYLMDMLTDCLTCIGEAARPVLERLMLNEHQKEYSERGLRKLDKIASKQLVSQSASPDDNLEAALLQACDDGDVEKAMRLIESGANPSVANVYGWTPLRYAKANKHDALVETLIELGADINAKENPLKWRPIVG